METVRITAKTVDEAVEEGLKKLGLSRAEAVIRVIEPVSYTHLTLPTICSV